MKNTIPNTLIKYTNQQSSKESESQTQIVSIINEFYLQCIYFRILVKKSALLGDFQSSSKRRGQSSAKTATLASATYLSSYLKLIPKKVRKP